MSRAGRKRKLDQKRKPSGDIVKKQTANPIVLQRRIEAAKDIRAELDAPLSVLFHSGLLATRDDMNKIIDDGRDLYDAGSEFGARYWRLFGKPFGRAADPNIVRGQDAIDPVRALRDELAYDQAINALDRLGRNTRRIVLDCCAHMKWTPSASHLKRLRVGLKCLYNLPRPRLNEDQIDHARAELAA